MNHPKITEHHHSRLAYVYLRQSTPGQVLHHQESTERQYALREKAEELGWNEAAIRTLDRDLGKSGAQMAGREDFKTLVADVSMGQVGAVLALEASRLSRSDLDWHRLLELCALTKTLVIDEDGCYDPSDFNDGLLLGLKGTMAQAELHFLRTRLLGGKLNKAKKGELRFPLAVGFRYEEQGRTILDPDEEVRGAKAHAGSGLPDWRVRLSHHHEGYITEEEFFANLERLHKNCTHGKGTVLSGPAREGLALLQGLLLCGRCGHALTVRYTGNGGIVPQYLCNWLHREALATKDCMSFRCDALDPVITEEVFKALQPAELELALGALRELEVRDQAMMRQWQMRVERAEYGAALAERRYEEVDPSNRLVVGTLEHRWNDALVHLEDLKKQAAE